MSISYILIHFTFCYIYMCIWYVYDIYIHKVFESGKFSTSAFWWIHTFHMTWTQFVYFLKMLLSQSACLLPCLSLCDANFVATLAQELLHRIQRMIKIEFNIAMMWFGCILYNIWHYYAMLTTIFVIPCISQYLSDGIPRNFKIC